jgi:superfamily II DNA or RNA helicase
MQLSAELPLFAAPSAPPLRPYQRKNALEIEAHLQRENDPLYYLPTGGGKTRVLSHVTGVVSAQGGWETTIFVHRRELLSQCCAALQREGVEFGVIAPGEYLTSHRVHVASIDTVGARLQDLKPWLASLRMAIFDEAHHCVAGKWGRALAEMPQARKMGVTATPFRTDGQGLGDVFSHAVKGPSIKELTAAGILAPAVVYGPPISLDLGRVKKRGGDFVQAELARLMDTDALTLPAVRHYARLMPGVPTVVFCAGIDHAEHVAAAFTRAGWAAASVDGGMHDRERDDRIQGLADGRLQVLTSCDLISEGTDIPVVGGAILLRPTQSTGLFLQQVGRVLRTAPGKSEAFILDLVGNVAGHGMPDADRKWSLKGGLKGLERAVEGTRRCRRCYRVHAWADTCPGCGQANPRAAGRDAAAAAAASLPGVAGFTADEIYRMPFKQLMDIAKTEADLRAVAQIRGYKAGWVKAVLDRRASQTMYRRGR